MSRFIRPLLKISFVAAGLGILACGKEASSEAPNPGEGVNQGEVGKTSGSAESALELQGKIVAWISGPQVTKNKDSLNAFTLKFTLADGSALSEFKLLDLTPYMKIHGHGVPKAYMPKWTQDNDLVQVTGLGFIMAGPWELKVLALVKGKEVRFEIPIEVP